MFSPIKDDQVYCELKVITARPFRYNLFLNLRSFEAFFRQFWCSFQLLTVIHIFESFVTVPIFVPISIPIFCSILIRIHFNIHVAVHLVVHFGTSYGTHLNRRFDARFCISHKIIAVLSVSTSYSYPFQNLVDNFYNISFILLF